LGKAVVADIGDAYLEAEAGEPYRGGKPDAGGASSDDGDIAGGHGWVGHEYSSVTAAGKQQLRVGLGARARRHRT
jgi:hypothetical protein